MPLRWRQRSDGIPITIRSYALPYTCTLPYAYAYNHPYSCSISCSTSCSTAGSDTATIRAGCPAH